MSKPLRHLLAIGLLPFVVTIVVPAYIVGRFGAVKTGWGLPALATLAGGALVVVGLVLICKTVALFATVGDGTLAPWDPPRRLVVRGPYRRVRNPMISGVLCVLLGEAFLAGSVVLLGWFAAFFAINAVTMPLIEEPALEERFGPDYAEYKRHVPRWVPRLRPWEQGGGRGS